MTTRDIAALICKSLALFFIVPALTALPASLQAITSPDRMDSSAGWFNVMPVALLIVLALLLWFRSEDIARHMTPDAAPAGSVITMTTRDIAALICKSLALLFVVPTVSAVPMYIQEIGGANSMGSPSGWMMSLPGLLQLVLALLLWFRSEDFARWMAPEAVSLGSVISIGEAQVVAFSAIGVWVFILAVSRLVLQLTQAYVMSRADAATQASAGIVPHFLLPQVVECLVQAALGLWLLLGASGLVSLIRAMRDVGRDKEEAAV